MASERSKDHQLGTLVVVVLKARNLPDKHTFTKQDPFAVVQLGSSKASTEVDKRGGQHPVWDQDLHVQVSAAPTKENRTLKVSCYAKESKSDDLIGEGEVDVSDTLTSGEFDDWIKLEDNGAYRGEIYLEMTYFAAGPPKLERRPSKLAPSERLSRLPHAHPNTPPKAAPHATPYGPSSARHVDDLPTRTSPQGTHLALPRSSHTPSPSTRNDAPLPPLPEEIPPSLLPHKGRAPAPRTDPKAQEIPSALRPGGPPRPSGASHQRNSSVPTAAPAPAFEPALPSHVTNAAPMTAPAYNTQFPHTAYVSPNTQDVYSGYSSHHAPSFPEPSIPGSSFQNFPPGPSEPHGRPQMGYAPADPYAAAAEREREAHLQARYGSPMPLPPGAATHAPSPAPAHIQAPAHIPTPAHIPPPAASTSKLEPKPAARTPIPDAYLKHERETLSRVRQEEADAELARRLQAEAGGAGSSAGPQLTQRQEEADAEFARRLARELNTDVLKEARKDSSEKGSRMPGGW